MCDQLGELALCVLDECRGVETSQDDPQGQRVDEHSENALDLGRALQAPEQDAAEDHVVTPSGPGHHQRPGGVKECRHADPRGAPKADTPAECR